MKKFLSEFTLIKERAAREAVIWQDYLVFGAMFGIADKVAAPLSEGEEAFLPEASAGEADRMRVVMNMSPGSDPRNML